MRNLLLHIWATTCYHWLHIEKEEGMQILGARRAFALLAAAGMRASRMAGTPRPAHVLEAWQ